MASFKGYIRLDDGTDQLLWNEVDVEGVLEDCNQFLGWNDWTEWQMLFYINPPSVPITPPPSTEPGVIVIKRSSYFQSERIRVFESVRERVFLS